jgi:hypothetical protein
LGNVEGAVLHADSNIQPLPRCRRSGFAVAQLIGLAAFIGHVVRLLRYQWSQMLAYADTARLRQAFRWNWEACTSTTPSVWSDWLKSPGHGSTRFDTTAPAN